MKNLLKLISVLLLSILIIPTVNAQVECASMLKLMQQLTSNMLRESWNNTNRTILVIFKANSNPVIVSWRVKYW